MKPAERRLWAERILWILILSAWSMVAVGLIVIVLVAYVVGV